MRFNFKTVAAVTAMLLASTSMASALTGSGTVVSNSINVSYSSGGNTINNLAAATATFTVDRKIDLLVQGLDASAQVYAQRSADVVNLSYQLENKGNDASGYDINVAASVGNTLGLTYDASGTGAENTYYVVLSDSATPGAGTEVVYDTAGVSNIGLLASGGMRYIHIYANITNTAADLDTSDFTVTATSLDGTTNTVTAELRGQGINAVDVIFADPGVDGKESATETLTVQAPTLTSTKTMVILSENLDGTYDCATGVADPLAEAAIPGACVEYTIKVANAAGASLAAVDLSVTDELPTKITYVSHTVGTFDTVDKIGGWLTASMTSLAPGDSAEFKIRATVGN